MIEILNKYFPAGINAIEFHAEVQNRKQNEKKKIVKTHGSKCTNHNSLPDLGTQEVGIAAYNAIIRILNLRFYAF